VAAGLDEAGPNLSGTELDGAGLENWTKMGSRAIRPPPKGVSRCSGPPGDHATTREAAAASKAQTQEAFSE
jgi:hypothetical protein